MNTPGYEKLADVLNRAFDQAASGKGRERHAQGEPFHEQVMQIGAKKFGVGSLLFQAFKKSEESQRLPHGRAVAELLGSIVYLAGAVIALEASQEPPDDAVVEGWHRWSGGKFAPVSPATHVEVMLRNGNIERGRGLDFYWNHALDGRGNDIIMFRVVEA